MTRMHPLALLLCLLAALASQPGSAVAQTPDLYDPNVLRTFNLQFHDANWLQLLRANYPSQTMILADLEVDGETYPDVGVRIRGNTSYTQLPAGSEKFSLKIYTDHVHPDQKLLGYDNLNLNNGFLDPTFMREVLFNNYAAQFIPNIRANHVQVTLNDQNWGVYINVQQGNKRMLRDYFAADDGLRIGCSNNPNGPGLAYNGESPAGYGAYEISDDGGLADPYASLIAVTRALSTTPLPQWQEIDTVFAIDPSIWTIALENAFTDEDGYISKGCDILTYTNPSDGRMHLLTRDNNETFKQPTWAINRNFNLTNKPVLNRVLAVPELRQRYMAHYRVIRRDVSWDHFQPIIEAQRQLIDAAVQADPKKIYSYTAFQNNITSTVNLGGGGPGGGSVIGLKQFLDQRETLLAGQAELIAAAPTIDTAQASIETPTPQDKVWITADLGNAGVAVGGVDLFYQPDPSAGFQRVAMLDDGASGDGSAGDGIYGALLPVTASAGQRVNWYVGARGTNSYQSLSFLPEMAERGPNSLAYVVGETPPLRISEWMYSGLGGEFIEFTNVGEEAIDVTGWSVDDSNATAGAFDLSAFGSIAPGESVIVTETAAETFRSDWGLPAEVKIIGELGITTGNNLGRNDQINLFDADGNLIDRLDYGDQTYPDSIRTQNASGQTACANFGQNDVMTWELSVVGDDFGSVAAISGDIGTPGSYRYPGCTPVKDDTLFRDGFEGAAN